MNKSHVFSKARVGDTPVPRQGITTAKLLALPMRSVRSDALIQEIRYDSGR